MEMTVRYAAYSIKHSGGWPTAPVTQKRSWQPCTGLLHHSLFTGTFDGVMEHFQHTYYTAALLVRLKATIPWELFYFKACCDEAWWKTGHKKWWQGRNSTSVQSTIIFTKIYTTQHFAIKPFHKKGTTHSTRAKFTSNYNPHRTDTQVWLLNRIPHPPGLHYVFPRVSINTMQLYKQQYTFQSYNLQY